MESEKKEPMYRNPLHNSKLRNKPCICGNGKKSKKCHGKEYAITKEQLDEIKVLNKERMAQVAKELNEMKSIIEKQENNK